MWQFFLELNSKRLTLVPSVFVPLDQRPGNSDSSSRQASMHSKGRRLEVRGCKRCIKVQEKKKKVVVLGYRPPKNAKLGIFRRGRAITAKKCTKKRDARFANLNRLLFAFLVDVALVVA